MYRNAIIAGLALLLLAASEARAGLMVPDAIAPVDTVQTVDTMIATAPPGDEPSDRESPFDATLRRIATQPAESGAGATGSSTSTTMGFAPVAILASSGLPTSAEPSGVCVERANSQLPLPPTSDLLRPPRHAR